MLKQLKEILVDVLDVDAPDVDDLVLTRETTANDVEGWDSLTHIQIVVAVEKSFKVRFTSREIQTWNSIGDLIDCIASK
jgi:acyl carrier protein